MISSRKGLTAADYISFVLVFIFIFTFMVVVGLFLRVWMGGNAEFRMESKFSGSQDDIFFLSYLRQEYSGNSMADIILEGYADGDYSVLAEKTSSLLKDSYGRDIDWECYIEGKEVAGNCLGIKCDGDRELFYDVLIPAQGKEPIRFGLRLWI